MQGTAVAAAVAAAAAVVAAVVAARTAGSRAAGTPAVARTLAGVRTRVLRCTQLVLPAYTEPGQTLVVAP